MRNAGARRPRRWVLIALGAAIAGNLLGAGGAMYVLSGGSQDLTVDEAIRRYRSDPGPTASASPPAVAASSTPTAVATSTGRTPARPTRAARPTPDAPAAGGLREPRPGVYVYATEGYEETDALSGQRHTYPPETTLTISRHGCGLRFRWQPLRQRWDESDGCLTSAGVALERFATHHEFFKRGVTEDFALEAGAVVLPANPVVGDRWRWKGRSDDSAIDTLTTVIGFETIAVGGKRVRTVHIRYETRMTGANDGIQTQDRWMVEDTGLLVRIISAIDAKVDTPFGDANYTERYRIDLTSTEPAG